MNASTTIFALATPPLPSAIALMRISGPLVPRLLAALSPKKEFNPGQLTLTPLKDEEKVIDQALVAYFPAPRSYTGEDVLELYLHGSMLIVQEITAVLRRFGCQMAAPGEFTQRAYFNHKLDLVQAEAVNDIIRATSPRAKQVALNNLGQQTSLLINQMIDNLTYLLAQVSVNIDYPEYYDVEQVDAMGLLPLIADNQAVLTSLLAQAEAGKMINEGVKVALIGRPNVGKSTLLNALLKTDKAITSDIPGTTRDVVEGQLNIDGITFNFFDTAGIRATNNPLEKLGVERSRAVLNNADIVLLVTDTIAFDEEEIELLASCKKRQQVLIVQNKVDDATPVQNGRIAISALNQQLNDLPAQLVRACAFDELDFEGPFLVNLRQIEAAQTANEMLEAAKNQIVEQVGIDIVAQSLELARLALMRLVGTSVDPDLSEAVFKHFCIGK